MVTKLGIGCLIIFGRCPREEKVRQKMAIIDPPSTHYDAIVTINQPLPRTIWADTPPLGAHCANSMDAHYS